MKIISIAAISAALAVALGAFGAHALKTRVPVDDLAIWQTAVTYQMWHSLALLLLGVLLQTVNANALMQWSARCFVAGIVIFSGSLYLLVLTNTRWLGAITPLGGIAFIIGWLLLVKAAWMITAADRNAS